MGFDPSRIAAAIADEVEALADQKDLARQVFRDDGRNELLVEVVFVRPNVVCGHATRIRRCGSGFGVLLVLLLWGSLSIFGVFLDALTNEELVVGIGKLSIVERPGQMDENTLGKGVDKGIAVRRGEGMYHGNDLSSSLFCLNVSHALSFECLADISTYSSTPRP